MPRTLKFGNISKEFKRRNAPIIQMRHVGLLGVWLLRSPDVLQFLLMPGIFTELEKKRDRENQQANESPILPLAKIGIVYGNELES